MLALRMDASMASGGKVGRFEALMAMRCPEIGIMPSRSALFPNRQVNVQGQDILIDIQFSDSITAGAFAETALIQNGHVIYCHTLGYDGCPRFGTVEELVEHLRELIPKIERGDFVIEHQAIL